ncbi:MAG TPA: tRNA (adenosine(37)-N6)-threonylcarbamoyltransferase complex ATPase subunit type 1 TsaE [Thiothrix sp.]|nr:tRNA (adenosine(37)-N6)-threonylcarbamoyltransferase complex ATPase subunit type 1 TsaE [Thiothrix sp.]
MLPPPKSPQYIADEAALYQLASTFAQQLCAGDIVYLTGDLGAGKTTFVRGILRALGYQGIVKSPTYTLVEPYTFYHTPSPEEQNATIATSVSALPAEVQPINPLNDQGLWIYHFDLYRLGDPEELAYLGGRDYFAKESICLIEWPEKAVNYLPEANKTVFIEHLTEGRKISFSYTKQSLSSDL